MFPVPHSFTFTGRNVLLVAILPCPGDAQVEQLMGKEPQFVKILKPFRKVAVREPA